MPGHCMTSFGHTCPGFHQAYASDMPIQFSELELAFKQLKLFLHKGAFSFRPGAERKYFRIPVLLAQKSIPLPARLFSRTILILNLVAGQSQHFLYTQPHDPHFGLGRRTVTSPPVHSAA
eukprot:1158846-Pelagomonas_calceolata.AAC.8